MIKVTELSKSYRNKKVLDGVSFDVEAGELFALLGSNGAGKSTTIKIMLGLVKSDSGDIKLPQGSRVGYSPETPYFPPYLTGMEVLKYYGKLQGIPRHKLKEICEELMEEVGLDNDGTKVRYYSKGMLQRLALAQALLGNPEILILDEPCAGLDAMGRLEMLDLISQLKQQGKTIIMNSHILSDIEKVCDRGIIMKKGKKVREFAKCDITEEMTLEKMFVEAVV
ncbi:MAG: ABC transporter ATP-binding protein [Clostridiales bacterium]|nr:ABC transporter ATP-binding protein [Clostridiales bacterium]